MLKADIPMRLVLVLSVGFLFTILSYSLFSFFWGHGSTKKMIRVYTYSSFASSWGPGAELAKKFEKRFNVKVIFVNVGEAGLLVERVKLDSSQKKVDVVLGLDQLLLSEAQEKLNWEKIKLKKIEWDKDFLNFTSTPVEEGRFVPIDWAPLSFIARQRDNLSMIDGFEGLLAEGLERGIGLQDPRTSTVGLQFLFWVMATKGENEGFFYLKKLFHNIHSVSPSWGKSYGLFQKGNLKTVLSYFTSPIYHWKEDNRRDYHPIVFKEGHIVQLEYAAISRETKNLELSQSFIRYLLTQEAQKIIMERNFMFPVIDGVRRGTLFDELPNVKLIEKQKIDRFLLRKKELIKKWVNSRRKQK